MESIKIFKTAMKYISEKNEEKAKVYLEGVYDSNIKTFNSILTELTDQRETILMYATYFNCFELSKWLIQKGANEKYASFDGFSVATHINIKDIEKAKKFIRLYHDLDVDLNIETEDYSWCIIRRVYEENCTELIKFVEELGYKKPSNVSID